MTRPTIEFDDANRVMTIDGLRYSYEYFEIMSERGVGIGHIIQVIEREPGGITFSRRLDLEEAERAPEGSEDDSGASGP